MSSPNQRNSSVRTAGRRSQLSSTDRTSGRRLARRKRGGLISLGVVIAVLALIQLVGSPIVKSVLNRKLADLPGYSGNIEDANVALWRGSVELKDFFLRERGHEQDPPLLHVKKASMTFAPGALLRGKLGGTAMIDGVQLNIIKRERLPEDAVEKAKNEIEEAKERVQRWQEVLRESFPVTLARLEVKNARFQFVDLTYAPNVEVDIRDLSIVASDLQNRPKANGDPMPAKVSVTGLMTGNGKINMSLQLDPIARQPHFALNFELTGLQLPPLNSFLQAYVDADVSRGSFELFSEINAEGGAYDGYLKPMFHELDFRTASDRDKNFGEVLKEKVVSALASVLENKEKDQVATKAPFAGNFSDNDVDIWTTIANLLRNAFVQALRGGFETDPAG